MGKPDNQQRCLAGEYYVASIISRMGYDVAITIARAKAFDMVALGTSGRRVNIQVKATYHYDWLVKEFDTGENSVVALVRLVKDVSRKPELYLIPGSRANELITHKYKNYSPYIRRADIQKEFRDHDFEPLEQLLR